MMKNTTFNLNFTTTLLCLFISISGFAQTQIDFEDFNSGGWATWIWNDGGSDCATENPSPINGTRALRIRDNTSSSTATTNDLDFTPYSSVTISFIYQGVSMENNEDFWLRYSDDGGGNWTNIETYVSGTDFSNGTNESVLVTLNSGPYVFTSNSQFQFRCDASGNNDLIYIDDVEILGYGATAPANDLCADATALPCGTTNLAGSTVNASNIAHGTGCTWSDYGVWYTFTGDGNQTTIDVDADAGYDHAIAIASGSCGGLTNIACEDSWTAGGVESYTFNTVNGTDYYIYVAYWGSGSTTGGFTISRTCVTPPTAPPNDLCADAMALPCGTTNLAGSTVNASNIAHGTGCTWSDYGVWYTFSGDGNQTTIDVDADAGYDHAIAIASGSCGGLTNIACEDSWTAGGVESYTFNTVNGTDYYIYVAYWGSGSTTGDFTISRSCVTPPTAPPNDLCADATSLPCGTTDLAGTTNGSTNITNGTGCDIGDFGVWYTFTGDGNQTTIDVDADAGFDHEIAITSGSCGTLTNIACEDSGLSGGVESYTFTTVNGTDYYVYISHWQAGSTTTGDFTISRTCVTPPTDPCDSAISLPCGTSNLAGTTNGATEFSNNTGCSMSDYGAWYTFTGDGNQTTISVDAAAGYDHEMAITSGSCGTLTNITCEDSGLSGGIESYTFNTVNGTDYYVYIAHYGAGNTTTGNFTISRTCDTPADDPCDSAISLPCGTSNLAGTTNGSTEFSSNTGCSMSDYGAWYTFTGDGDQTTITVDAAAGYDHEMAITSGSCGTLTNITCEDSGLSGGIESYTFNTVNGTDYYVYIAHYGAGNTTTGNFTISRTCTTPPTPPDNDDPCTATVLTPDGTCIPTSGTLEAATDSGIDSCFGTPDNDVWYSFVATNTAHTVTISNFAGSDTDMYHAVYGPIIAPDDCNDVATTNNLTCEDFEDFTELSGLTIGATYYVQVFTYSAGPETTTFDICVTEPCSNSDPINNVPTVCPLIAGELGVDPFVDPFDPDPSFSLDCTNPSLTLEAHSTIRTTDSYVVEEIAYTFPNYFPTGFGTPQVISTDDVWADSWTTLPFNFCFYGTSYTEVLIGANGMITFDSANIAGSSCGYAFDDNLPSTTGALFNETIYGAYHDIDPTGLTNPTESWIEGTEGCRKFITAWRGVPMFGDATVSREYTGMIVLHETTNIIEVFIENKRIENGNNFPWNDGNAIVGLQGNASAGEAITAPCRNGLDTNWEATNEAWRFVPNGSIIAPDLIEWFSTSTGGSTVIGTGATLPITTPDTYFAEVTYTTCGESVTLTDDVVVDRSAKTWNGSVNNNWYVHDNWTPTGVPTLSDCVLIPDLALSNNRSPIADNTNIPATAPIPPNLASALNLTIELDGYLEIASETNLKVVDYIQLNGTIDIRDSGSLIQVNESGPNVNNNSGTGSINMQRTVPGGVNSYDYVYWSSPTEDDFNVTDISSATGELIYEWNPTLNGITHGDWIPTTGVMSSGKGYIVRGLVSTAPVPENTAEFSGKPQNGVITVPITRGTWTAGPYEGPGDALVTALDDNWNLIGNPYPSAISYASFISANSHIDGTIYFWTHQTAPSYQDSPFYYDFVYNYSDDYIDSNYTGSNPPSFNGDIAAGQGFFVLMRDQSQGTSASEDVIFNNTMRNETLINSEFYRTNESSVRRPSEIERHRIWLDLINPNEIATSILIGYVEGATNDNDRLYDGYEFAGSAISFYSLIDEDKMSIQGKALPFEDTDTVPLGLVIPEEGNYTIAINSLDGLFSAEEGEEEQTIYLEDTYNGIIHDLRVNPYSFTSEVGRYDDRFVLRYTDESLGTDEFNSSSLEIIAPNNAYIKVTSGNSAISSVTLYDLLGRVLIEKRSINNSEFILQTKNYSDGPYIVKAVLMDGNQKLQKVIIKN